MPGEHARFSMRRLFLMSKRASCRPRHDILSHFGPLGLSIGEREQAGLLTHRHTAAPWASSGVETNWSLSLIEATPMT